MTGLSCSGFGRPERTQSGAAGSLPAGEVLEAQRGNLAEQANQLYIRHNDVEAGKRPILQRYESTLSP
jgi:hypothetical protein